ncbi:hypothetical protein Q8A73_022664 [Channa argus]|nr:hypothetical protein Q8A73_022664 [Channa argus]
MPGACVFPTTTSRSSAAAAAAGGGSTQSGEKFKGDHKFVSGTRGSPSFGFIRRDRLRGADCDGKVGGSGRMMWVGMRLSGRSVDTRQLLLKLSLTQPPSLGIAEGTHLDTSSSPPPTVWSVGDSVHEARLGVGRGTHGAEQHASLHPAHLPVPCALAAPRTGKQDVRNRVNSDEDRHGCGRIRGGCSSDEPCVGVLQRLHCLSEEVNRSDPTRKINFL